MPRPRKCRRVCALPRNTRFGPLDEAGGEAVIMSIDEYEVIRLIDVHRMTQEECAEQMNIARTTVQKIYNDARYKLALLLVYGQKLLISGGDYEICPEHTCEHMRAHGCGRCGGRMEESKPKEVRSKHK